MISKECFLRKRVIVPAADNNTMLETVNRTESARPSMKPLSAVYIKGETSYQYFSRPISCVPFKRDLRKCSVRLSIFSFHPMRIVSLHRHLGI